MKIELRCLPGYEHYLPKPVLARGRMPGWLKDMPPAAASQILSGADVRTVKQCPPFVDAMQGGILFPLACDLRFEDGHFSWDWDLPYHPHSRTTRSPLGVHVPEQASGVPGADPGDFIIKFNNFWTVVLPEGWSMLFGHPANRTDLPFQTLSGLVDCDRWCDGLVHFPALWRAGRQNHVLPAGTPVAQGWPVKRDRIELTYGEMDEAGLARHKNIQDVLSDTSGVYRKTYRSRSA